MNKLRIGVLCKDLQRLAWWELKLFAALLNSPWAELSVLIMDRSAPLSRIAVMRRLGARRSIAYAALKAIVWLEQRVLKPPRFARGEETVRRLAAIPTLWVEPVRKGVVDRFTAEDVSAIRALDLDVILRHNFGIIKGDILDASRHGIWSLHHGDNAENRGGPPGFWEIVQKEPVTGVTLQRLTEELDGGLVVGKAFYSTQRFFSKNANFIHDKSPTLVLKWLGLLAAGNEIPYASSGVYSRRLFMSPGWVALLRYVGLVGVELMRRVRTRILLVVGIRSHCWSLSLGKGDMLKAALWRSQGLKAPPGAFWADPFALEHQGKNYVLFENYSFARGKADISYGRIESGRFAFGGVALTSSGHLSYPFVVEHEGSIYMLPEAYQSKRLEVWKATNFPTEWTLHATALLGESVVDPTLYIDQDGKFWLFVNICKDSYGDHNSELYIYQVDGFQMRTLTPHRLNPVLIDSRGSRSAGRIFLWQGRVIRPSQINQGGVYGAGLKFSEIVELSLDAYREADLDSVYPNFKPGLVGIHHADQFEGGYVFDSCQKYRWR